MRVLNLIYLCLWLGASARAACGDRELLGPPRISRHGGFQLYIWRLREAGFVGEAEVVEARVARWMQNAELRRVRRAIRTRYNPWLVTVDGRFRAVWKPDHPDDLSQSVTRSPEAEEATSVIDRTLDLRLVPLTLRRSFGGEPGSLSLFIEHAVEPAAYELRDDAFFLQTLIRNADFRRGSLLRYEGRDVLIDASDSFQGVIPHREFSWEPYGTALADLDGKITSHRREDLGADLRARRAAVDQYLGSHHGFWLDRGVTLFDPELNHLRREFKRRRRELGRIQQKAIAWLGDHLPTMATYETFRAVPAELWRARLGPVLSDHEFHWFLVHRGEVTRSIDAVRARLGDGVFPRARRPAKILESRPPSDEVFFD